MFQVILSFVLVKEQSITILKSFSCGRSRNFRDLSLTFLFFSRKLLSEMTSSMVKSYSVPKTVDHASRRPRFFLLIKICSQFYFPPIGKLRSPSPFSLVIPCALSEFVTNVLLVLVHSRCVFLLFVLGRIAAKTSSIWHRKCGPNALECTSDVSEVAHQGIRAISSGWRKTANMAARYN